MNKEEIDRLLENYFKWLKDKTISSKVDSNWVKIATPYLDRHNDYLQIYVKRENEKILISDDGYIINDLILSGCSLDTPRRKDILNTTLNGFGINLENEQLFTIATEDSFPQKKHDLLQAMLAVNDLFYLAHSNILNLFLEDVTSWFDEIDVRYTPKVKFIGKSGFDNQFDFCIPKSKNFPERVVQTISNPSKESIQNLLFRWSDTKERRPSESNLLALINDSEKNVSMQLNDALKKYNIQPIEWSKKSEYIELLAA